MDFLHAVILAIVEGVTEFLPVSSTGHMMITAKLLNIPTSEFLKTFEVAIQFGAIMAVVVFYWRTFILDWEKMLKVCIAFVPTAIIGLVLYKFIKKMLLGNLWVFVWALFIGGALLIIFERRYKPKGNETATIDNITLQQAIIIGIFQAFAVIPGVSRSAATIIGGLLLGINRVTIVEFSFLLAVPTMLSATVLDLLKTEAVMTVDDWLILGVGFLVAFIVALGAVKFLLGYIRRFNFTPFGIYRVIAAVLFACCLRS